jgi:DsbC/DsbD-like thiol-disulfide interchange protein
MTARQLAPLGLLSILCLPLCCWAQQNKLTVAPADEFSIKRGASATQTLKVEVLPGFHVNSDKPRDEFLIPLKLTWTGGPLEATAVSYPKPEEIKVGGQTLVVFTGSFVIRTDFKAPANASPGAIKVTGKLHYQACNSDMCFRPATLEIRLPVVVE